MQSRSFHGKPSHNKSKHPHSAHQGARANSHPAPRPRSERSSSGLAEGQQSGAGRPAHHPQRSEKGNHPLKSGGPGAHPHKGGKSQRKPHHGQSAHEGRSAPHLESRGPKHSESPSRSNDRDHAGTIARGGADDRAAIQVTAGPAVATFAELQLAAPVLRALEEEGYTTPTPIQGRAIGPLMAGKDMLGCAQTGTGKTAAFALPILHLLQTAPRDMAHRGPILPRALVLSPTRELATQIGESFAAYGRHTGLRGVCIFGGVSQGKQVRALREGVDIVVATPGRLIDLLDQGLVDLSGIRILVLDEADRMLDMGFIMPIRNIVSRIGSTRQTMLFSATMPREIMKLADSLLKDPVRVAVTPVASAAPMIEQSMYMVPRRMKSVLLEHLLQEAAVARAVVFTKTKHGADKLAKSLNRSGISASAIHGNKAQRQRERVLDGFRAGRSRILVATDVAARGLDVDGITHVFNFDLPMEPEAYVHRIGRTGRAGAKGTAISFCGEDERGLLRQIERTTGRKFDAITRLPELPEPAIEEKPSNAWHGASHRGDHSAGSSQGFRPDRNRSGRPGWRR